MPGRDEGADRMGAGIELVRGMQQRVFGLRLIRRRGGAGLRLNGRYI